MSQLVLTLELPDDIYERVQRTAKGMKQPMEQALATIVRAATPSLEKVPLEYRAELEALEDIGDDLLWQAAEECLTPAKQRRMETLLDKNEQGDLTKRERLALTGLRSEADRLTLRRAYASLLLRYRGHPIPNLPDSRS
jgi:hypothetical protein